MSGVESLFFYIILFTISTFLVGFGMWQKVRLFTWLGLAIPILIAGLRYNVGTDYSTYVRLFESFQKVSFYEFITNPLNGTEVGFYILNRFSDVISHSPAVMFGVTGAICVIFFYLGLNRLRVKHAPLIYFLYLMTIFPLFLNVIRQAAAASIIFFGFCYILQKKPGRYVLTVLIACLFHTSAIFMLLLYPLYWFTVTNKYVKSASFAIKVTVIGLLLTIILPLLPSVLINLEVFSRYDMYSDAVGMGANMTAVLQTIILVVCILIGKKAIQKDSTLKFLLLVAVLNLVFMTALDPSQIIKRMTVYLSFAPIILLPQIMDVLQPKSMRFAGRMVLVAYAIGYFILAYYILGQAEIIPYDFNLGGLR